MIQKNGMPPVSFSMAIRYGDLLAMFALCNGSLSLFKKLKAEFPSVHQPWYMDNAGAGSRFALSRAMFKQLLKLAPDCGYLPKPPKSIFVVSQHNLARV
jgi:hypothetical protein